MTQPTWTPDVERHLAEVVAKDRAVRWGYDMTLEPDRLVDWCRQEAVGAEEDVRRILTELNELGMLLPIAGREVRDPFKIPSAARGKFGPKYAECASPQAIEIHLREQQARVRHEQIIATWLSALYVERLRQVEAGEWPPPRAGDPS